MKKKLALLLVAALALSVVFIGCRNDEPNGQGTPAPAETGEAGEVDTGDVERIVIFQSKVEIYDELRALAAEYYAETGIYVEVWGTTGDDYFQQLSMRLGSFEGPTIFNLAPGSEVEALADHLADLSSLSFINDIISDDIIERVGGRIVGIPYAFEGFGFVYNRDLYQSGDFANVDSVIAKMQRDATVGLSGESFFLIGHILNAPFALQDDPEAFMAAVIAGEQTLTDVPEFQDFARLYAAIRDYSYNPLEMDYPRQMGGLATGAIGAVHQGNWSWGMLADYDMDFEVGMAPVPLLGNDALSVSVPSVWAINADASPAEIQAGLDFLDWLYTSETGQRYLFEEFGFLPVLYGVESPSVDPLSAEVLRFVEEGRTIIWATNFYPAGIVDVHLVPVAEAFFTTNMSEEELLIAIQEAFMAAGN